MNPDWKSAIAPQGADSFGAYVRWPENMEWSTQLVRLLSYAYVGATDFSEIESVVRGLRVGDDAAWQEGFAGLAGRLAEKAQRAADGGHRVSAVETWRRASIYYRLAATFTAIRGAMDWDVIDASRRCFRSAAQLDHRRRFESVEIPYEDSTLPGYFVSPAGEPTRRRPTVIVFGGIDAFAEEMYFKIGAALLERGFNVLLPDGPGQGESRRRRIPARTDYEVAVTACVDYLTTRHDVDTDRIGLIGSSLGGYIAGRAAGAEHRLTAVVIWGAFYGVPPRESLPSASQARAGQFKQAFAVGTDDELWAQLADLNLEGVGARVKCPVLILHAQNDVQIPVEHAQVFFDEIGAPDKELIIYPPGEPGCAHCQLDSLPIAQFDMANWLEDRLA